MKPTPETDAFAVKLKTVCGNKEWVPVDLSRQLERERDEAKHDFEEQSEVVRNLKVALMEVSKLTRTLKEERDEAREALKKCREDSICYAEHMRRCGYAEAYKESKENADRAERILKAVKRGCAE